MELVGDANEGLEEGNRASRVLLGQIDLVVQILLLVSVLIEGSDSDTILLADHHLDVDPVIKGQEDSLRVDFLVVVLGIDIDSEGGGRVVPDCKHFVQSDHVVVGATFKRVSTEGVLSKVFHPE